MCFAKVRGRGLIPADQAVRLAYEQVKSDPKVISLQVPNRLQASVDATDKVRKLHKDIEDWTPEEFTTKHAEAQPLLAEFESQFKVLMEYYDVLQSKLDKKKKRDEKTKRNERTKRDQLKETFAKGKCPEPIAKLLAEKCQRRQDRYALDISTCYSDAEWGGPASSSPSGRLPARRCVFSG